MPSCALGKWPYNQLTLLTLICCSGNSYKSKTHPWEWPFHFKHSKGKPLTLTIKGATSPQDCPLQIMKAYLTMRGATAGPLFLYCPSMPVTRAKFNEQLRGALQFCYFCPKQFKSHSFRTGAATTAAAQGMSDSQIRSLGRGSSDVFMKYIRCSQRVSALWTITEYLHDYFAKKKYMLGCLAAAVFHIFQIWKCFSAAECLYVTGLESSQTWTKLHPEQQGWSHNGNHQLTILFGFISQRYSRFGVQFSHLAFFWGQHFYSRARIEVHGVVFPQKDSPGETIHSARRICFP